MKKYFTTLLIISITILSAYSQSISGNAKSSISTKNLGFANVNIYKNGALVANVLTDENGDFNVKLDTGYYKCEIVYAGYEKITKNIRVSKDEKADFSLSEDKTSKYAPSNIAIAKSDVPSEFKSEELSSESVVKMGYASESRSESRYEDVTGAITVIKESEIYSKPALKSSSKKNRVEDYAIPMADKEESSIDYAYEISPPTEMLSAVRIKDAVGVPYEGEKEYTPTSSKLITHMWGDTSKNSIKKDNKAQFGKLTAGEINDFSKWDLWTDLTKGELNSMQTLWNFIPHDRYTVQLINQNKLPIVNATVELYLDKEKIFTSKSDNTGRAELWGSLIYDSSNTKKATSIKITYNNEVKTIENIKKINEGINTVIINSNCQQSQNVEIAIVVDATGSMQDEIDYLKMDLNHVIYESKTFSSTLNLRFANIFYRDKGDDYVTQTQNFTSILSESIAYTNLHNANGGGDEPESVEIALDSAINKLTWSNDTRTKILFLVLDASPHNTLEIQEKLKNLSYQAAEKGIRIVPIAGSGIKKDTEYLLRCLALATNGTYVFLTDDSGIGSGHIKPSTDNYKVEILNDLLVRIIKSYTYLPNCEQIIPDLNINLPDSIVKFKVETEIDSLNSTNENIDSSTTTENTEFEWKFYPNPTNGILNIVANKEIKELYISDLSGKALEVIKDIKADEVVTIDLLNYPSGIYLIRYPIGKQWISGKIILKR